MKTENISTLKIHKLTQEQYNRELEAGRIDESALYLTPVTDINPMSAENPVGAGSLSINRLDSSDVGNYSVAVGYDTTASGEGAFAEGFMTKALGDYSHAEGLGYGSTPDELETILSGLREQYAQENYSTNYDSLTQAQKIVVAGLVSDYVIENYGDAVIAQGRGSHSEGGATSAIGDYSHAEGYRTQATGNQSHAEGGLTIASGARSHAEGSETRATGNRAHAEGGDTEASGNYSHAQGYHCTASGNYSFAGGHTSQATDTVAFVQGFQCAANGYQAVFGKWNTIMTGVSGNGTAPSNNDTMFIIGNGTAEESRSNAFRITSSGNVYPAGTLTSNSADFAEYFEWIDGNSNNEDRRGKFVTLDGEKIKFANAEDDYILGVVSVSPCIVGNAASEEWHKKYIVDEFGERITTEVEIPEYIDETTQEVVPAHTEIRYVLNPEYDAAQEYVSREFRQEWSPIGLHGQLLVKDDGTCTVNGYCKVADGGIATASETGYRVIKRVSDNIVKIIFK